MYVRITVYLARESEADAVLALHEYGLPGSHDWNSAPISWDLLRNVHDPRSFLEIVWFRDELHAGAHSRDEVHRAWHRRLENLVDCETAVTEYRVEWQSIRSIEHREAP